MIKQHAEEVLTPHIPILRSCFLDAWQKSLTVKYRHLFESRTKAGIVRDLVVAEVKEKFGAITGVKQVQTPHYFFLEIGTYLIRFKKFDSNRLPHNVKTPQSEALEKQQLDLPETAGRTILNAGYVTDTLKTKISSAFLTCQMGKSNLWEIQLGGVEHGFIVLPVQQQIDDELVLRPRKDLIEKEAPKKEVNSGPL